VEILAGGQVFSIEGVCLSQTCARFATGPLPLRYSVTSRMSRDLFLLFVSAINGTKER
jgi:hypothetical protein